MEINLAALHEDCEKFIESFSNHYVQTAADKFTELAKKTIIDVYYNAYDPEYYRRTDDLKNNSYQRYVKNNGSIKYGGVIISDDKMSDYENYGFYGHSAPTPASNVLQWAWGKGYHGYLNGDPGCPIYTFPPISALQQEIGSIKPSLASDAWKYAESQSYSVLQF